jgi:trimethylamine---corrinoid protein Co-methyltransferase
MTKLRPKIQVLTDDYKKQILKEAKEILSRKGIFMENKDAIEFFENAGITHQDQRYFIPPDIIDKALQTVPSEFTLFDREGKEHTTVGKDTTNFDPGSAAIYILDECSGNIRAAQSKDFSRFSKIVDQLKNINVQSTALVYQDVKTSAQDWHRLYLALLHGNKPVVTGTFRKESFSIMRELLLSCRSSEKDLADKPLAIFDACPSPPLMWSDLTTQSLVDAAKSMIPSEFVSMPLSGATAPITLIGSITQHCAECLAGVVIVQLANKGAPLVWGGSPAVFDMKFGTTPMGAIESMMINLGDVEMGKFLNLPTHAYMSLSDAKIPDAQAGFEAGMGAMLAGLAGINMVSGPGMLDFESTQSIEKLLIDNEIAGMVHRLTRGIEDYGSPFALDILEDFDEQNSLLAHPTTLKYFRKELFFPSPIVDRKSRDLWKSSGSLSSRKQAKILASKLVKKSPVQPISTELKQILEKIVNKNI